MQHLFASPKKSTAAVEVGRSQIATSPNYIASKFCQNVLWEFVGDFSSRPWRSLPPTWVIHMAPADRPQHADPHGLGAFLKKTIQEIHVDRRVVDRSAGHHVDHPCGWQISPWPTRKVTEFSYKYVVSQTTPRHKTNTYRKNFLENEFLSRMYVGSVFALAQIQGNIFEESFSVY